jgi:hypothetical protein
MPRLAEEVAQYQTQEVRHRSRSYFRSDCVWKLSLIPSSMFFAVTRNMNRRKMNTQPGKPVPGFLIILDTIQED